MDKFCNLCMCFLIYFIRFALVFTHKLSLMSLPPWVQQDYHRFICSCLLLVKIEKSHMRSCFLWIEFWILREKSWCHWNSLPWTCMSRCLCLNLRKSWSSPRVQKSLTSQMRAFSLLPLYIPCLASQPLTWSSVFPFTTHIYLPFSYFPPEQPIFPWQESFLFRPGPVIYDVNC